MKRKETYQVFLLGDEGVGKLSIVDQFAGCGFGSQHYDPTDEFDYAKRIDVSTSRKTKRERERRVEVIHAEGNQRRDVAKWLTLSPFNTDGALVIYSVTSRQSFLNMKNYIDQVYEASKETGRPPWVLFLVGNKIDCEKSDREVTTRQGKELAASLKLGFLEVSAKTGKNVDEAFRGLVRAMMKQEAQLQEDGGANTGVASFQANNIGGTRGLIQRLKDIFQKWWS